MKRRLRHALICLLITASAAASGVRWLQNRDDSVGRFLVPEDARARLAVVLDRERWTSFRIPSTAMRLKLVSRANLRGTPGSLIDQEFPYEIEYQLESRTGQALAIGAFTLTGRAIPMADADGTIQQPVLFHSEDMLPASSRTSTLELGSAEILVLKLRARAFKDPIGDISVRAFLRQRIPDRNLAFRWNRLSPTERTKISRARVHELVDLTPIEKQSVLQNRWIALGADGVAGSDYKERTIYLRDDLFRAKRQLVEPLGIGDIRSGPDRRVVLGIPPPGGRLRLKFNPVGSIPPDPVTIRHFGETIRERSTQQFSLDAERPAEFTAEFTPGLLEIESQAETMIRPFWSPPGQDEALLEQDPSAVRAWALGENQAITFRLGGDRSQLDHFRASIRLSSAAPVTIGFDGLDASGSVVLSGKHEISCEPSIYDFRITPDGELPISDPANLVLELPPGVTVLRFSTDAEVFLNGYTRPATLQHRTRVPADYLRALPDPERLPVWFGLRPENADALIRSYRSCVILTQPRPPEDDADILAGKYQWEAFQPEAGALGQFLLSDRDPDSPSRDQSLGSLFMPLAVGQDQPLALADQAGLEVPTRRLAYFRSGQDPTTLSISIDGKEFFERSLVTARGEVLLPPIPPGSQTIRLDSEADGLECYINHVKANKATRVKRLAQRSAPGSQLVYLCEKLTGGDELLTGMWFAAPGGAAGTAKIRVAINPGESGGFISQSETYTPRDRIFSISPNPDTTTPMLGGKVPALDGGRRFFIPLGSDLQAGTYQISITQLAGGDGFLTLSKVTGGEFSDARFFREVGR